MRRGTAAELIQRSAAVSAATENINNEIQKTTTKLHLNIYIYIPKYISLCEDRSVNTLLLSNIKYTMYKSMQYLQTENAHKTSFRCATGFNKIDGCGCVTVPIMSRFQL